MTFFILSLLVLLLSSSLSSLLLVVVVVAVAVVTVVQSQPEQWLFSICHEKEKWRFQSQIKLIEVDYYIQQINYPELSW